MTHSCKALLKSVSCSGIRKRLLLLLMAVMLLNGYFVHAGNGIERDPIVAYLTGATALVPNANAAVSYIPEGEQSRKIKNIVTFSINEEATQYVSADFTATIVVNIDYGHTISYGNTKQVSLTVNYSKTAGAKYNAKSYFHFEGAEYVKVTIAQSLSINPAMAGSLDLRDILLLENELRVTQFFNLASNVTPVNLRTNTTNTTADELAVEWDPWQTQQGVTHTQLEWAWVETEMESYYHVNGSLNTDLLFRSNATRVDLPAKVTDYTIPKLYDGDPVTGGKIYYRIRAVNVLENGTRSDGPWSNPVAYSFSGHEPNLNWQVTTSFAEEGKRSTVIEYYDGSLRPRQTVTKDNETNTTVTAETFYDGQGRPAIQILPVPGITGVHNVIKYQANLNLFNTQLPDQDPADIFDLKPVTPGPGSNNIQPLAGSIANPGAAYYYSSLNPEKDNGANKYIPDAGGYPYTVTQYTPDATGRVMMQSGVGTAHQMGSDRETKYYYGSPSQEELDGLFGTEVGNRTHYFKNMVRDANGQMSVSYVDMHGRTIATALAGDSPGNLDALAIENSDMYPGQQPAIISRNLLDDNTNIIKNNSIEAISTLLVPAATTYNFQYSLTPDKLTLESCTPQAQLCYDCLYDLEISVTDESGDIQPVVWKFSNVSLNPDDNCATTTPPLSLVSGPEANVAGNTISFSQPLEPGSYIIRKTLTISESSLQHYLELYGPQSLCKTRQQIIDSVYQVLQTQSGCNDPETQEEACASCMANLGANETAFRTNYLNSMGLNPALTQTAQLEAEIHAAYVSAYENCQTLCNTTSTHSLQTIRELMLEDMKPYSGQYAREWDPNTLTPPPGETGWSAPLYYKYDIFSTQNGGQPFYKYPKKEDGSEGFYLDATGNPDGSIYGAVPASNTVLSGMTKDQFQDQFKDTWAASLLYYHPEFKKLKFAEDNLAPSYNWIDNFTAATTYTAALNAGYILTTGNTTSAPFNDPFYTLATPVASYRDQIHTKITSNFIALGNGNNASMWQIAYGEIKCKNITDLPQRVNCIVAAAPQPPYNNLTADENDRLWQIYRGFYANERRIHVNKYIKDNTPPPAVESDDLVTQKYRLHFPETDQQIANQGNQPGGNNGAGVGSWTWWPTTPNGPPVGVNLDPNANNTATYTTQCDNYIQRWKAALRPCLEAALVTNPAIDVDATLTQITDGMKQVCIKGSDPANPYGSSNVPPAYTGPDPKSFEEVIESVLFVQLGLPKSILCNPFVIDWPKPYGKGPKVSQEITGVVDSCACAQFSTIKTEAATAGFNANSLPSLNQYLLLNYQDTLSQVLYDALQNCSSYTQWVCDSVQHQVTASCYDPEPCTSIALFAPGTGPTSCGDFQVQIAQYFDAYGVTPPANCTQVFTDHFNAFFGLTGQPWIWSQITAAYDSLCGGTLNVCDTCLTTVTCTVDTNCRYQFFPHYLPSAQPLPAFLQCGGASKRCVNCAQLSALTAEFKTYFNTPDDAAPLFNNNDLTDAEVASNSLYAKFLNYRTGFQYNWLTYAEAAYNASPTCNLADYVNNGSATQNVICGEAKPLNDPSDIITEPDPCQRVLDEATVIGNEIWLERSQSLLQQFEAAYRAKCLAVQNTEAFTVSYTNKEYHYTLYYYDMAGSLVKTVPPAGVRPDFSQQYLDEVAAARAADQLNARPHQLITQYRYNSLGGVVAQNSPDGNSSSFWYDKLGRLVVSQNAQQAADDKYSYTLYDDLGRITEVGQKVTPYTAMDQTISQDPFALEDWIVTQGGTREQITFTVYDLPYPSGLEPLLTQENLRNRVSYTGTIDDISDPSPQQHTATYYTYDIHGNVDKLVQDYLGVAEMAGTQNNRYKLIAYDYDLISGKVNMVSYQPPRYNTTTQEWETMPDAFYHQYRYDAQNRLKKVLTSRDKIVWETDAAYQYYKYGPLARAEYGKLHVQGMDYAYTIQGWLKGVNSTAVTASGGSCPQGTVMGDILNVSDRAQYAQPAVYTAQQEINFNDEFESTANDEFETLLDGGATVCDPATGPANVQYVQGDMGRDGDPADVLGAKAARDAYGFSLNYFNNDYTPINTTVQPFATGLHNLPQLNNDGMVAGAPLYNGNIASMLVNIPKLGIPGGGNSGTNPIVYGYRYDQLNRIVGMNAYKNDPANTQPNVFSPVAMTDYRERVSYDPNGNILTYHRNGTSAPPASGGGTGGTDMDQLGYKYLYVRTNNTKGEFTPGQPVSDPLFDHYTNQLASVQDAIGDNNYTIDIDNQAAFNYEYDRIGNLVKDVKEHITNISWTVYGKISSITKDADGTSETTNDITTIIYTYDAGGNRVAKTVTPPSGSGVAKTTIYVRDASGNVMSVYEKEVSQALKQTEIHLYGSSRIGMITEKSVIDIPETVASGFGKAILSTFTRNEKLFELSNHLGNVLVTISDKKIAFDSDTDGEIDYYEAEVVSANDYYPGGMEMPGRKFAANGSYRYGFNGKEKDTESPVQYDYGFRIYDPRLVRFKSVDPLTKSYPWYTPYQFAGNNPIKFIDLDGLEEADPTDYLYSDKPKIDMNGAPSSSPANAQGFPRNAKYFWQQMLSNHPEYFSPDNTALINKGYSPWVDEVWVKNFPSDAAYMDNKLIHHHTQGKNMAVAIPEKMHWDKFSELHAYLGKAGAAIRGARVTGTLNGVINILGFASDITGIIKDNPDALGNQFSKGLTTFEENIDRVVNQHFGDGPFLDQYIVIREVVKTTTTQYNSKGEVIAQFVSSRFFKAEIYSDYVWDEDQGKYIGVNLYGTQVGVYNYDKNGNVVSAVEKRSDMSQPVITNGNPSTADIEKVRNN